MEPFDAASVVYPYEPIDTVTINEPLMTAYAGDLAQSGSELEADPFFIAEEKYLVRKLDQRILPIVCLLYLFACESRVCRCVSLYAKLYAYRSGQDEPWKCAFAGSTGGCSWRRSYWKFIWLGQLRVFLSICEL
jgi:hypothetical protein